MGARTGVDAFGASTTSRVTRLPLLSHDRPILPDSMHAKDGRQIDSDANGGGPYRMTLTLSDGRPRIGGLWTGLGHTRQSSEDRLDILPFKLSCTSICFAANEGG